MTNSQRVLWIVLLLGLGGIASARKASKFPTALSYSPPVVDSVAVSEVAPVPKQAASLPLDTADSSRMPGEIVVPDSTVDAAIAPADSAMRAWIDSTGKQVAIGHDAAGWGSRGQYWVGDALIGLGAALAVSGLVMDARGDAVFEEATAELASFYTAGSDAERDAASARYDEKRAASRNAWGARNWLYGAAIVSGITGLVVQHIWVFEMQSIISSAGVGVQAKVKL